MGSFVLIALLAGLIYYLLTIGPANSGARFREPTWLSGWPRTVLLFVASLIAAWMLTNGALGAWLNLASAIGRPVGLGSGHVTIIALCLIGFALYRTGAASKIKAFAQNKLGKTVEPTAAASATQNLPEPSLAGGPPVEPVLAEPVKSATPPKRRGLLFYVPIFALCAAAGWLVVSRFAPEKPREELPRASVRQRQAIPEPASPNIFRYRVSADTVMRGQYSSSGVQKDSCVEAAKNPDGTPPIHGNDILVQAFGEDGEDIRSGLIPRDVLRNQGVRGSCHAVFLETQIPDALETQGPIQQWGVDGSSDLRDKPDPTAPIIGSLRTGSCVMSTGKVKGHFMEVTIDTGVEQRTLWTAIQNYKPTVIETCQAKTIFTH